MAHKIPDDEPGNLRYVANTSLGAIHCDTLERAERLEHRMSSTGDDCVLVVGDNVTRIGGTLVGRVDEIIADDAVLVYWPGAAGIVRVSDLCKVG